MTKIKCSVTDCIYNQSKICQCKEIEITDTLEGAAECCNLEIADDSEEELGLPVQRGAEHEISGDRI